MSQCSASIIFFFISKCLFNEMTEYIIQCSKMHHMCFFNEALITGAKLITMAFLKYLEVSGCCLLSLANIVLWPFTLISLALAGLVLQCPRAPQNQLFTCLVWFSKVCTYNVQFQKTLCDVTKGTVKIPDTSDHFFHFFFFFIFPYTDKSSEG